MAAFFVSRSFRASHEVVLTARCKCDRTVAVFGDFQFFPDTLPLFDGAKKAIGADEALATVTASPIVIFATPLGYRSEIL